MLGTWYNIQYGNDYGSVSCTNVSVTRTECIFVFQGYSQTVVVTGSGEKINWGVSNSTELPVLENDAQGRKQIDWNAETTWYYLGKLVSHLF